MEIKIIKIYIKRQFKNIYYICTKRVGAINYKHIIIIIIIIIISHNLLLTSEYILLHFFMPSETKFCIFIF